MDSVKLTKELLKSHGLHDWSVSLDRAKTRAGKCSYRMKTIFLSKHYISTSSADDIRDTILHEIAHALTPGEGHSALWKSKAIEIGCSGDVHCKSFTRAPFHITCSCRAVNVYRHRVRKWVRERGECKMCKNPVMIEKVM